MEFKSAFLCASAFLLALAPALADVPTDVQKTIAAEYQLTCTAVLSGADKDLAAAFAPMAPTFVSIDFKGKKTSRDEVIADAKQQMKVFHGTSCTNTLDSVTQPDPNTVVVVVTQNIGGTIQAPDGNHDLLSKQKTQDTWKLTNGQWQTVTSKDLRTLVKIDGKVVQDEGE